MDPHTQVGHLTLLSFFYIIYLSSGCRNSHCEMIVWDCLNLKIHSESVSHSHFFSSQESIPPLASRYIT